MSANTSWEYYNHAFLPKTLPHEVVDVTAVKSGTIWKETNKSAMLARWTSDFDCKEQTNWWYIIKDEPFDITQLKAKRRYEINKGKRNYSVKVIEPKDYLEALYTVTVAAFEGWPEKYRPHIEKESFFESTKKWVRYIVYGLFSNDSGTLCGYALLEQNDICAEFCVMRVDPACEKNGANAALVTAILEDKNEFLMNGGYICDGARSIRHETAFQDYLEKYFGFRKAYCKLHIEYNPKIKWIIKIAYPIRKFLELFNGIGVVHQLTSVLKMEEICRTDT